MHAQERGLSGEEPDGPAFPPAPGPTSSKESIVTNWWPMLPATGESPEIRGTVWYRDTRVKGDGGASGIIGQGRGD